jgi:hypothetical protein
MTLRRSEGFVPVPVISNEVANHVKPGMATDRHKEEVNTPSDLRHQYNPFTTNPSSSPSEPSSSGTTSPDVSVSLYSQWNPSTPPVTGYKDQGASRARPHQSRELNRETTPASFTRGPAPSTRYSCIRETARRLYSCKDCGKEYAQPQGLRRHRIDTHEPELCIYCLSFQWGRPYILRKHLKDKHPELNLDAALEVAMRSRRGTTRLPRRLMMNFRPLSIV